MKIRKQSSIHYFKRETALLYRFVTYYLCNNDKIDYANNVYNDKDSTSNISHKYFIRGSIALELFILLIDTLLNQCCH